MIKGKNYGLYCFFICLLLSLVSFGYFIWEGGGVFTLRQDFNVQQIPFSIAMNDMIKNGDIGWLWNVDLGTNSIGAFSCFNLGSPFFWLSLLFPAEAYPYLVGWLYILKYSVAGAIAYAYLQRFAEKKEYAVLGGVLYAFSGFQTVNIMFQFQDVVAFFPLLLIGIEKLVTEKKRGYLLAAVGLNCLLNYYFFAGEVIFLILYFLCRFGIKKESIIGIFSCCLEGILGIGLGCILFLPSVIFIQGNPDGTTRMFEWTYSLKQYLEILKGILLPAEPMYLQSAIMIEDYSSNSCYLPGVGLVFVIAYLLKNKGWIRRLIVVSLIISMSPLVNSMFYVFAQDYRRWWYMPTLIMILATVLVLENLKEYEVRTPALLSLGSILVYLAIVFWQVRIGKIEVFSDIDFMRMIALALLPGLFFLLLNNQREKLVKAVWVMVISISLISTWTMITSLKKGADKPQTLLAKWSGDRELDDLDINYRYYADNSAAYIGGVHPLSTFNSTVTSSIYEMHNELKLTLSPSWVNFDTPGVMEWLGGKYYILQFRDDIDEIYKTEKVVDTINYENRLICIVEEDACPIAFTYDNYMLKSEFNQLEKQILGVTALKTLIIPDEKEELVAKHLKKADIAYAIENIDDEISQAIKQNNANIIEIQEMDSKGFRAYTSLDEERYAFFSVPYDKGWTAYVNGEEREIIKTSGLMSVLLNSGENRIEFKYEIPGFKAGIMICLVSLVISTAYIYYDRKKKEA